MLFVEGRPGHREDNDSMTAALGRLVPITSLTNQSSIKPVPNLDRAATKSLGQGCPGANAMMPVYTGLSDLTCIAFGLIGF